MSEPDTAAQEVWVLGLEDPGDRGFKFGRGEIRYERGKLTADQLRDRIGAFLDSMRPVVERIPATLGGLEVDTIALKLEITAKGKVSLVGTGGEIGGTGGITLTLSRPKTPEPAPHGAA
jgi:hypothetical protein